MKRIYQYLLLSKKFYASLLLGLAMFIMVKLVFILRFGNLSTFTELSHDIPLLIFNSMRFDLQSIVYLLSLVFLINFTAFFIKSDKVIHFINKFSIIYITIIYSLALALMLADHQFYSFFKLHFNAVAFDFFNEGPLLLLKSIWLEHPVIKILTFLTLSVFIIRYFIRKIYKNIKLRKSKLNIFTGTILSVLVVGIYFLFMRGSLGTFPLQNEDINVSESEFINACVPNGLYMLQEAYGEAKKEIKLKSPQEELQRFGFNSIQEAYAVLKDIPLDSVKTDNIDELIFTKAKRTNNEKYNVVMLIMESMSSHFIQFHNEKVNLLGSFERHYNEDIVFTNYQSSGNGTIVSLEDIILNAPFHSLFETKYRFKNYDVSIAKPFKDAGYETKFITGIELGWRHLDETLKRQYFDNTYGKNYILSHSPEAESNDTWGVYDHHVFDYIYKVLEESDSAQFILNLSSTNHTPYELPKDYKTYPIDRAIAKNPDFSVSEEQCINVLTAYQYSTDAVGRFMDKIKNSELANNTIVIVTGDHNSRSLIAYNTPELQKFKYSVPLYIYMPEKLKKDLYIDINRYGSHNDIMTSIYPCVLNGVSYLDLGQNLFDENIPTELFYSINDEQLQFGSGLNKKDVVKKKKARNALLYYYYSKALEKKK